MFWNKWIKKTDPDASQTPRHKPPADLPHQVGRHLVVNLQKDPDWVWNLKAVVKPAEGEKISTRRFRVYDPLQSAGQGIKIHNYDSLDACPELILYEGNFDKVSNAVSLAAGAAAYTLVGRN